MFEYRDSETGKLVNFLYVKKDVLNNILTIYYPNNKYTRYRFPTTAKLDERINWMINQDIKTVLNGSLCRLANIEYINREDILGSYHIEYHTYMGTKVEEVFNSFDDRENKINTLAIFRVKISDGSGEGTDNYEELLNKPSINGVTLVGDTLTSRLNIKQSDLVRDVGWITKDQVPSIDMSDYYKKQETYNREEIDEKLKNLSGTKEIEGTAESEIVADELDYGVYILSGIVKATQDSSDKIYLKRALYSVWKEEDKTIICEENKYSTEVKYYVLFNDGAQKPESGTTRLSTVDFVIDYISSCVIDGGVY